MRFRLTTLIIAIILMGVILGLNMTDDCRYGNFADPKSPGGVYSDFISSYGWPMTFYSYTHHDVWEVAPLWSTVGLCIDLLACIAIVVIGAGGCELMLRSREKKRNVPCSSQSVENQQPAPTVAGDCEQ